MMVSVYRFFETRPSSLCNSEMANTHMLHMNPPIVSLRATGLLINIRDIEPFAPSLPPLLYGRQNFFFGRL